MSFYLDEEVTNATNIKVVGVGGGGGNAVNRMVVSGLKDVEFVSSQIAGKNSVLTLGDVVS